MIHEIARRARALRDEREQTLAQHRKYAADDPTMTGQQREEYLAGWRTKLDAQYRDRFAALRTDAADHAANVHRAADRVRPTLDPTDAAALIRTEQAWRNVVLPQLDAGRTLREALAHADTDAVLGAQRFAAGHIAAQQPRDGMFQSGAAERLTATVTTVTDARLASILGDAGGAELAAAAAVDGQVQAVVRAVDHAETGSGSGLEVAVGLHLADPPVPR